MTFTLRQLQKAWDESMKGMSIGCVGSHWDSMSFDALLLALMKQKKRKHCLKRKGKK